MENNISKNDADIIELVKRLQSIADIGLLYSVNDYDKERYAEIKEISLRFWQKLSGVEINSIKELLLDTKEYPTAKVDIRGILIEDRRILLVREMNDGRWSLPGGWADIGYSPKEVMIKEFKEETGIDIIPERLLAIFDKKKHPHPPQPFYVYKLVFHCKSLSSDIKKGFDMLDVQFFDIDHLPELSENRILKSQIQLLYKSIVEGSPVYID